MPKEFPGELTSDSTLLVDLASSASSTLEGMRELVLLSCLRDGNDSTCAQWEVAPIRCPTHFVTKDAPLEDATALDATI